MTAVRELLAADLAWAAELMAERRAAYEALSPVFWRPAAGIAEQHAAFLGATVARPDVVAVRTDHGFAIAVPTDGRAYVDDFAVDDPARWVTDGAALLDAVVEAAAPTATHEVRVVTARRDEPKRALLLGRGMRVGARWWVRALDPTGPATVWGPAVLGGADALVLPAPLVYDPGGPVCLFGDLDAEHVAPALEAAAAAGAVLAIVRRDGGPVPEDEPVLEAAGFHNPSEFYDS